MAKLIGLCRIGNDPELRYTSSNMAVLQLSLAYSYGKEKKTQWVSATLFGKRAEALEKHLAKGQLLYVEVTDVYIDVYTAKDGTERTSLKGIIQEVEFTGKAEPAQPKVPQQAKPQDLGDMQDDIPF